MEIGNRLSRRIRDDLKLSVRGETWVGGEGVGEEEETGGREAAMMGS